MDALREALAQKNAAAVDAALSHLQAHDPRAHLDGLRLVLASRRKQGVAEGDLTSLHTRIAEALLSVAATPALTPAEATAHALEAMQQFRDVLNDGEATTRALVLALRLAADDAGVLEEVVAEAGGAPVAITLLEKALKQTGKARDVDVLVGRLRRALARVAELFSLDTERAFFENLRAARKLPQDVVVVDDVYRLALETNRIEEAAAFFQALSDEGAVSGRARASALHKLGLLQEERGDPTQAFAAYVASLQLHETKSARRKAERLKGELNVSTPLPAPRVADVLSFVPDAASSLPTLLGPPATLSVGLALDLDVPVQTAPSLSSPPSSSESSTALPGESSQQGARQSIGATESAVPFAASETVAHAVPRLVTRDEIGLVTVRTQRPAFALPPPPPQGDDESSDDHEPMGLGRKDDEVLFDEPIGDDAIIFQADLADASGAPPDVNEAEDSSDLVFSEHDAESFGNDDQAPADVALPTAEAAVVQTVGPTLADGAVGLAQSTVANSLSAAHQTGQPILPPRPRPTEQGPAPLTAPLTELATEPSTEPRTEHKTSLGSEHEIGQQTGQQADQQAGQQTGQQAGQQTGQQTGQQVGQKSGRKIAQRRERKTEQRLARDHEVDDDAIIASEEDTGASSPRFPLTAPKGATSPPPDLPAEDAPDQRVPPLLSPRTPMDTGHGAVQSDDRAATAAAPPVEQRSGPPEVLVRAEGVERLSAQGASVVDTEELRTSSAESSRSAASTHVGEPHRPLGFAPEPSSSSTMAPVARKEKSAKTAKGRKNKRATKVEKTTKSRKPTASEPTASSFSSSPVSSTGDSVSSLPVPAQKEQARKGPGVQGHESARDESTFSEGARDFLSSSPSSSGGTTERVGVKDARNQEPDGHASAVVVAPSSSPSLPSSSERDSALRSPAMADFSTLRDPLASVENLVADTVRSRTSHKNVEDALAFPAPVVLEALRAPLLAAEAAGLALPFVLRRTLALALVAGAVDEQLLPRLEALCAERPNDVTASWALALFLASTSEHAATETVRTKADARRLVLLENLAALPAGTLTRDQEVQVWSELAALRNRSGKEPGDRDAARRALRLLTTTPSSQDSMSQGATPTTPQPSLAAEQLLSDRAVRALVNAWEELWSAASVEVDIADVALLEYALALDQKRARAPSEKARLQEIAAQVALRHRRDANAARHHLQEALRLYPDASSAREALFDLEMHGADLQTALAQSRKLLQAEKDRARRALLHLRLYQLQLRQPSHQEAAIEDLRAAVELDPRNVDILDEAERFLTAKKDLETLDAWYAVGMRGLDRNDVDGRLSLLERWAQVRRYERRDLRGAVEVYEAMAALDPAATKPRADAAWVHGELGQWKEAVVAWRSVLEADPFDTHAWRGLFSALVKTRRADEAFAVAATMTALEIADDDMVRAVKAVRPPFPRWPTQMADSTDVRRRLLHPLARGPVRGVLELVAHRLLPRLGRAQGDFGVRRHEALDETRLPASVAAAVRVSAALAGLGETGRDKPLGLSLYGSELASEGTVPSFAALPAREPGLIITAEVLKGGMTPERAFALGRAVAWLPPWALLAASAEGPDLTRLFEGLVTAFLSVRELETPTPDLERSGAELREVLTSGLSVRAREELQAALAPALRDWLVGRRSAGVAQWKTAVAFTGDRIGFLLCGDLRAALQVIRRSGASAQAVRASVRALGLFSISASYFDLRRDLGIALSDDLLAPVLELG
jgi:tetratricopeptide (TPR) repeat protein